MAAKKNKATAGKIDRQTVSGQIARDKGTMAKAQKMADKGYAVTLSRGASGELTFSGSPMKKVTPKSVTTGKGTMTGKSKKK